jgi:hypothetical protein
MVGSSTLRSVGVALALLAVAASTASAEDRYIERASPDLHGAAFGSSVSSDGSRITFSSRASLAPTDTDTYLDVYERVGPTVTHFSTGPSGGNGAFDVTPVSVSEDGRHVYLKTQEALTPDDTDGTVMDIYERSNGITSLVSRGSSDSFRAPENRTKMSADGSHFFFETYEALVPEDTNMRLDEYVRAGGVTTVLVPGGSGASFSSGAGTSPVSADGSRVFFDTGDRLVAGDTDDFGDVYERFNGSYRLVTPGPSPSTVELGGISRDGTRAFFVSAEQLTPDDQDAAADVYQWSDGVLTRVSRSEPGVPQNGYMGVVGVSGDGSHVFTRGNRALTAADTDGVDDIYDHSNGTSKLVSTGPLAQCPSSSCFGLYAGTSFDGTHAFFKTPEREVSADTDSCEDLYERFNNTTRLLTSGSTCGRWSTSVLSSPDGSRIVFQTDDAVVPEDGDGGCRHPDNSIGGCDDVYEQEAGVTTLVSKPMSGGGNYQENASLIGASQDLSAIGIQTEEALTSPSSSGWDYYISRLARYARPKGATPILLALVPAYRSCGSPNRQHGPALAAGSCNPPVQRSTELTTGRDANFEVKGMRGFLRLDTVAGDPATPADEANVRLDLSITDVRLMDHISDYTGELQARPLLRISDKDSTPGPVNATVQDTAFPFTVPCAATAATAVGSTCAVLTTADAVLPDSVKELKRTIWQLERFELYDGGPDGVANTTADNTLFANAGIFVP